MATHSVHHFVRALSESDDGRAVYGCDHARCGATEVRRKGEPSPFAVKHAARTTKRKGTPA
jgi:hypothetical protein